MPDHDAKPDAIALVIERDFAAPATLVFSQWLDAAHMADWFAPDTYVSTACTVDARPGGRWRIEYRSDSGHVFVEHGEYREIDPPRRLVMTLTQQDDGRPGPETVITVTFTEAGGRTHMRFVQTGFDTAARRDSNGEGWQECFAKLARRLGR